MLIYLATVLSVIGNVKLILIQILRTRLDIALFILVIYRTITLYIVIIVIKILYFIANI